MSRQLGTGSMEKQCLSGLHQDPIGSVRFSFSEVSVMAIAQCHQLCRRQQALIPSLTGRLLFFVLFFSFFSLLSAVIQLDDQPMGMVVLVAPLGGARRFRVARPSGTSSLQTRRDKVVPAYRVSMDASLRCLYSSGPSPLTFKAPVPKLI